MFCMRLDCGYFIAKTHWRRCRGLCGYQERPGRTSSWFNRFWRSRSMRSFSPSCSGKKEEMLGERRGWRVEWNLYRCGPVPYRLESNFAHGIDVICSLAPALDQCITHNNAPTASSCPTPKRHPSPQIILFHTIPSPSDRITRHPPCPSAPETRPTPHPHSSTSHKAARTPPSPSPRGN